jgi:hypothetical protein
MPSRRPEPVAFADNLIAERHLSLGARSTLTFGL